MGQGHLKVAVHTAGGALPVAKASVIVAGASGKTLHTLETDTDGLTKSVALDAPDKSTTMAPGVEGYSTYQITVEKAGFVPLTILGAQVFDTIESTQPVILHPQFAEYRATEQIALPDNELKQNTSLIQLGPQPTARTLADVIIPSKITVHMGTPAHSTAKNITVSFPEYIKNVASSEIYATWPQAALEANIYAIISLALNRVYTEWYRSRGFNFDITNSTQYDQYFKEGQTIPDNISELADRLFNQYLRRTGFKEPLFSSYCNGTTSTCPGMSQWGTVDLANDGYSTIAILKHYYGHNIDIVQTDNVSSVLTSFPGYTLSQGHSGDDVAQMQEYLNRIAGNFPAIPQGSVDGKFGSGTAASVRAFQKSQNLPQTGAIDKATWNRISYLYVSVTDLAELGSEGQRIGIGASPPNDVLKRGSRGKNVVELQFLLEAIGAYYSAIPPVYEDNIFGPGTLQAVLAFQQQFGLMPDGIVGPATWQKLYTVYRGMSSPPQSPALPPSPAPPYPGHLLKEGSVGKDVRTVQAALNKLADKNNSVLWVIVDGIFGPATLESVKTAQRAHNVAQDGIVGPVTWKALFSL